MMKFFSSKRIKSQRFRNTNAKDTGPMDMVNIGSVNMSHGP